MLGVIIGDIAEALQGIPDELKECAESVYLTDAPDILEMLEDMYQSRFSPVGATSV